MNREEKIAFLGLLVFLVLLALILVQNYSEFAGSPGKSPEPFIQDRVVEVQIVMQEDDWQEMKRNSMAEQYVRADFWFDGEKYPNVAIRPKGNSSLMTIAMSGSERMSFKVDFNFFNFAQAFRGLKKLNFNNGFSDPTLIRETLGYEIFKHMDLPTPRTAFVDLWVNDVHLGLYTQVEQVDKTFLRRHFSHPNGNLYKPQVGPAALKWTRDDVKEDPAGEANSSSLRNKDQLAINMGGARLSDLLNLLERESSGNKSDLNKTTNNFGGPRGRGGFPGGPALPFPEEFRGPGGPFPDRFAGPGEGFSNEADDPNRPGFGMRMPFPGGPRGPFVGGPGRGFPPGMGGRGGPNYIEAMGLKTNENYSDHSRLFELLDILNKTPDESFPREIENILDVNDTLKYLAVSTLIVHLDNYIGLSGHNYYLYENDGKFTLIPWDLNMSFGTFTMGVNSSNIADLHIDEPTSVPMEERPLVARLFAHKPYLDRYHSYLEEMLNTVFAEGVIEARIDELTDLIRPNVKADDKKFFSTEDFEKSITDDLAGGGFSGRRGRMRPGGRFRGFGPMGPGGPGRIGGPSGPGLKSFIRDRRISVRKQLDGELPSKPDPAENQNSFLRRLFR